MIDSEMEIENENHEAGKRYFASAEEWIEDNITQKLKDFTGVSVITIKCDNLQSVSEITELTFG